MKNNPSNQKAIALRYDLHRDAAPTVVAKGSGFLAEKILAEAAKNDIPVQSDPSLVQMLSEIQINEQIPADLYNVVAEVFAYIYHIDKTAKKLGKS
ncbi:MAG: EscU/YscU/HrcU family type III secretion system export apparatus switch protein [Bacilli bacterium]